MSTDSDSSTPDDIDRAAAAFAKLLLTNRGAIEAMRAAVCGVANVVNEQISPTPPLAGADVVAFLQALRTHLDDSKLKDDDRDEDDRDDDDDFEMPIVFIVFGKGGR